MKSSFNPWLLYLKSPRLKCKKCGKSVLVETITTKLKYIICTRCGSKIYTSKRNEFKDKLIKEIKKDE